jgi:hypothetical protein
LIVIIIVAPTKVTKVAPKHAEKENPTGPRPKIVAKLDNPADLWTEEVPFDAVGSQQPVATTATTTTVQFDDDDDDVSSWFNPPQTRTRWEKMVGRRSVEMTGLVGSKASVPNLSGEQPEADTAVGRVLGNNFGCFGSGLGVYTVSNDPLAYCDPLSRNQGRTESDFDHQEGENTAT